MLGRHQPQKAVANKSFLGRGSSASKSPELGRNRCFEKQEIRKCRWGQGRGARWAGGRAGHSEHGFSAKHTFLRDLTYAPLAPRPLTNFYSQSSIQVPFLLNSTVSIACFLFPGHHFKQPGSSWSFLSRPQSH